MTDTAAAQLSRLLRLLPELAGGEEHDLDAVARKLGVTRKVLLDDLEILSERYDDPGGFVEGVRIYLEAGRVSLTTHHFARPMGLRLAELCALELGLALVARERGPEEDPAIARARARLREVISRLPAQWEPDRLRYGELGDVGDLERVRALQTARKQRRQVRITYRKADAPRAESRAVCPYALAFASGRWYLIAYCGTRDGIRIFRVDRIAHLEPLDQRFEVPAGFDPAPYLAEGRVFHPGEAGKLRVRYSPRIARWIAEREGREVEADGSLTIEHPLADIDWAVRHVLQYGPDAEVLEPPEVRAELRRRLSRLAQEER